MNICPRTTSLPHSLRVIAALQHCSTCVFETIPLWHCTIVVFQTSMCLFSHSLPFHIPRSLCGVEICGISKLPEVLRFAEIFKRTSSTVFHLTQKRIYVYSLDPQGYPTLPLPRVECIDRSKRWHDPLTQNGVILWVSNACQECMHFDCSTVYPSVCV